MDPIYTLKELPVKLLENNHGQIEGIPANPRTITSDDYHNLKRSIENDPNFLQLREPIVYPLDGRYIVIAGNMRLKALKELPIEFIHVKVLNENTPIEDLARWAVKDNTSKGEWDWDALANEWDDYPLEEWGIDLPDMDEPVELPENIDEIPQAPKTPISKLGDLWLLGNHRVLCGDSTDRETVERLMDGKKADMVFTDPPYGMNLDTDYSKMKGNEGKGKKYDSVLGDNEDFKPELILSIFDNFMYCSEIIIWGADYIAEFLPKKNDGSWLVWDKRESSDTGKDVDKRFGSMFELAWSKSRHKREIFRYMWAGMMKQSDVDKGRFHPTQKPANVLIEILDRFKAGKLIIDVFLGSGSTLIACEQTDRICYGMELDPQYVDVICRRYQNLTGIEPILEATSQPHDFIETSE